MKQNRSAQRRQSQPIRQANSMEQVVLVQRNSARPSELNDNDPWTREELAALRSATSSQAVRIDQAFSGFEQIKQQVSSVTVRFEGLNASDRLTSIEGKLTPLPDLRAKFDALASRYEQTQKDLADAQRNIAELVKAQAKQDTQLTVLKYVLNSIAILVMGGLGHAFGPKLLELVTAALK